jgi:aminobenzoyl-glutamate utilization protein B
MVNMMREHIPSSTRIHYIITNGGKAPNVVPDFSEVYYYVRDKDREVVRSVFDRVINAAQGAALGTGTQMEYEVLGGVYNLLPNKTLAKTMFQNLQLVGGVAYTAADKLFAQQLQQSLGDNLPKIEQSAQITEFSPSIDLIGSASTDVADVSWAVPTVGLSAATWVPGTPAHSWQAVAASGMDIGLKGMMVAAKTIALTAVDLYKNKTIIQEAKAEFEKVKGPGFQYKPLLGDRKPALNYRD